MANTQKTVKLPNGEIAVALKITPSERAHLRCWNCKTHLVYEKDAETVKCSVCKSLNGTAKHTIHSQFAVFRCNSCSVLLKAPTVYRTVSCIRCGSISLISRN